MVAAPAADAGSRSAFRLMLVWVINNLLFVFVGLGGLAVNWITYLTQHGSVPVKGEGRGPEAWAGFMPFAVPWWYFAASAAVMLIVIVLARDPRRRWEPEPTRRNLMWRTAPPFLIAWAVFFAVFQSSAVRYYDVSWVVLNPYLVGPAISLVCVILAARIWAKERRAVGGPTSKPSWFARLLGVVSAVNLGLLTLAGPVLLAGQQLAYWAVTGESTPPVGDARTAADIWIGHLPLQPPWWMLFASGLVTLLVTVLAQLPRVQSGRGQGTPTLLSVGTGALTLVALIAFVIQWWVGPFSSSGAEQLLAPAACAASIAIALLSFRHLIGRASSKSRAGRGRVPSRG